MLLLDESKAADYLRRTGRIGASEMVEVRELSGGVSNVVLHVARTAGADFVLKQARGQLRVVDEWLCSVERIFREVETLRLCGKLLAKDRGGPTPLRVDVPEVLFEDRENYAFAMTSAPREHRVWKADLLAGRVDESAAVACAGLLARLVIGGWRDRSIEERLGDRQFFLALRVEPYYRRIAEVHADVRAAVERLIASLEEHRLTLVHGDFSPKNLLLFGDSLWLIDCEVGHFGDPAFDLGFFLTHLVLKDIRAHSRGGARLLNAIQKFWSIYRGEVEPQIGAGEWRSLEARAIQNLAGCLLARVDGKSRVDYLNPAEQDAVRRLAKSLLLSPGDWRDMSDRIASCKA
jgi:5-methylthioribose kinase